jgi:hypothetical protein
MRILTQIFFLIFISNFFSCKTDEAIDINQTGQEKDTVVNELLQPYLDLLQQEKNPMDSLIIKYDLFTDWKKFRYTTYGIETISDRNIVADSLLFSNEINHNGVDYVVMNKKLEPFYFHIRSNKNNLDFLKNDLTHDKFLILRVEQFRIVNKNDFMVLGELVEIINNGEEETE